MHKHPSYFLTTKRKTVSYYGEAQHTLLVMGTYKIMNPDVVHTGMALWYTGMALWCSCPQHLTHSSHEKTTDKPTLKNIL